MTAKNAAIRRYILLSVIVFLSNNYTGLAQLTANFSATPLSGCSPLIVSFTDQSAGSPTQWQWDLGNSTISTVQNPSTTYFTPGSYTIKLVVRNAAGDADSLTRTQYITVNPNPTVAFTATPLIGCTPLLVQFTNTSNPGSGATANWQWDFGDGNLSTQQNPSHTYNSVGLFNVTLNVTNNFGCFATLIRPQYINATTPVHADFTNTQPTNCSLPSLINFQNLSTGSGTLNYLWNFGDGNTSTQQNPSHNYTTAGSYTVTLIVTNNFGCTDTLIKPNAVVIGSIQPSFTGPSTVCVNNVANFINTTLPIPASAVWYFGDGGTATTVNASHIYTAAGFYTVKMIAGLGNCIDSISLPIQILDKPTADFIGNPLSSCSAPLTVNFTNQSLNGNTFLWNFGDGNTSTAASPSHTYIANGAYTVTLITTNNLGCSDTIVKTNYVNIQPPTVTINGLPHSGCAPLTHTFSATINSTDPIVSYLWNFGDGNTSTSANPTHTFGLGTFDITLTITTAGGCISTTTLVAGIVVSTKPTANFVATPRDVCAFTQVNFTDLSTGTATNWHWDFGDGGTSNQQNPIYQYQDTGYFTVTLIVSNNGCTDTIRFTNYIYVKPPIANFTPSFVCTNPFERIFTDNSIGADEWNWDFGDGNVSTLQNPIHTYASVGSYNVSLMVKNYSTGCIHTKTTTVPIVNELANFTASDTVICRNSTVQFTATGNNINNITAYNWNFGDGNTGTGINTSHLYTQAGKFNVQLVITDNLGCTDTLIKPLHIQVDGPTAGFTVGAPQKCLQSLVLFTDTSKTDGLHPITNWQWNFGDGNIINYTAPPFTHTYTATGLYNVSLKVTDSEGCQDSITLPSAIIISAIDANFSTVDTLSCPNQSINFTNASVGSGVNYIWNFGDGNSGTSLNPVHQYTADGVYTIQLIAIDQYGCSDTLIKPNYVTIVSPHANFTMSDSVSTCPPLIVNFTNTSNTYTSVYWDFGDNSSTTGNNPSHFYSTPGVYFARLGITSIGGCTDTITKPITIRGPRGNFITAPQSGCSPLTVSFTAATQGTSSFVWDFNDGNILATPDSTIQYTYQTPGNYIPKMILMDTTGCLVPITSPDTIHVTGVVANFGFASAALCDSSIVSFSDSSYSNDGILSYQWDFGDGGISSLQNPTHHYTTAGLYHPQLIVTTLTGCTDTIKLAAPVKLVASPQAQITNNPNGCAPLTVVFNGSLLVADTSALSWSWKLGNGNISNLQNPPPQTYTNPTTYTIELIVTNSTGCKDTVTKNIEAYRVPVVDAGADALVCQGSGTNLLASGADAYTWSPAAGLSCINCPNPTAAPADTTLYFVTGTTVQGCSHTDSVKINIKHPFVMTNSLGGNLCKGNSLRLFASGAATYIWSPATGLSNSTSATPTATPSVTTTYMVIGTDKEKCFNDTGYVPVKVFNAPVIFAGNDTIINVGQIATLHPTLSSDVVSIVWSPANTTVSSTYPSITVKPKETTTYLLQATNAGGCKSIDNVTVNVLCNGANIFIPNTFSPNGDGINEIFYPRGTGLFRVKALRIFDRWGELVFESGNFLPNDSNAGWNGTYRGQKLSPDVYVYMAEILCDNNTTLTLKGNVALIK